MKISLIAANDSFLEPLQRELTRYHRVKKFNYRAKEELDYINLSVLLDWCDVAFFDFSHYPLDVATQMDYDCKIITRLHGIEIYFWIDKINWNRVDKIICTEPQRMRLEIYKNELLPKTVVIQIGTNVSDFNIPKDKQYGKNLCMVGYIQPRKRFYTTIETLLPLFRKGWKLFVRGSVSKSFRTDINYEYASFVDELIDQHNLKGRTFFFKNHLNDEQFNHWFSDKDIIINNSMQEGYGKATFDAMSCGVYPLTSNWLGASTLFPEENLFQSQEELVEKIEWWENRIDSEKRKLSVQVRKLAEKHDERSVVKEIRKVIEEL